MVSNTILELLHQYGYLIFYFAFSLGRSEFPFRMRSRLSAGPS
ncbi:hypothetical protein [Paenibacillus sp. FSL K6-2862]